jgi:long-chain acyl-CoA synthetase
MTKIWVKSYPAHVPAEIDLAALRTLEDLRQQACRTHADHVAYVQAGRSITYRELDQLTRSFAALLQKAGFRKGDRFAIMLPNSLQYPVALFGALRAGLTVVNTNPLYTAPELEHQLADSGAQGILVLEDNAHVVASVIGRTRVREVLVTALGDFPNNIRERGAQVPVRRIAGAIDFESALVAGQRAPLEPVDIRPSDLAFLQYTGGTTGVAKGAMLTHANVTTNVLQSEGWLAPFFDAKPAVLLTAIPLYHIFALTMNCLLFARLGWQNVLIANPRNLSDVVAALQRYPVAFLTGVNTLFNALLHHPGFEGVDFRNLRVTMGGGMAVQAVVARRWKQATGKVLTQAWGLTETSPAACINPPLEDFNGSVGLPIPSTEIAIRDEAGNDLASGQSGEICVRGPQVTQGYWNRPDETANVLLPGGWLRTGDIGRMDARGYVYLEDRKKDMILVSGFNVYPNEVEAVAATHPAILEAAAVAQADERSGEVVALCVVRKDPGLTERDVIEHCRGSLAGYKVPRHVYFRSELPKTGVGKILRRALREGLSTEGGFPRTV